MQYSYMLLLRLELDNHKRAYTSVEIACKDYYDLIRILSKRRMNSNSEARKLAK